MDSRQSEVRMSFKAVFYFVLIVVPNLVLFSSEGCGGNNLKHIRLYPQSDGSLDSDAGVKDSGTDSGLDNLNDDVFKTVTVYGIQNPSDPLHPEIGTGVNVKGVIVTSPNVTDTTEKGFSKFFVEDRNGGAFSGILIIARDEIIGVTPDVADMMDITGYYVENHYDTDTCSSSVIAAENISRLGKGESPLPVKIGDPRDITPTGKLSDEYEGVYIEVNNVGAISSTGGNGRWKATGGLQIGSLFYSRPVIEGEAFESIGGILHFDSGEYVLEPRSNDDIRILGHRFNDLDGSVPDAQSVDAGLTSPDSGFSDGGIDGGNSMDAGADCTARAGHVVISQFASRGPLGGNDEFVELFNPVSAPRDISGWKLEAASISSPDGGVVSVQWNVRVSFGVENRDAVIGPDSYFLVVNKNSQGGYSGSDFDAKYTSGFTDSSGVRIIDSEGNVVDSAGFSPHVSEGGEVKNPCPASGSCIASVLRKAYPGSTSESMKEGGSDFESGNGYDTDDNLSDFVFIEKRTPRYSGSVPAVNACQQRNIIF